jgi:hypothetical protein
MQATFHKRLTAGLVVAWFAAFLLVAGIAPWARAQVPDDICTIVDGGSASHQGKGEAFAHGGHTLDCALCAAVFTPPAAARGLHAAPVGPGVVPCAGAASHLATQARSPLPARGPPSHS